MNGDIWTNKPAAVSESVRDAAAAGGGSPRRHAAQASSPQPVPTTAPRRTPPLLPADRPRVPMDYKQLWDIDEVANYLNVPKQTIYSWRQTGYGPKGFRVGKYLRWHAATVIQWTLGLERDY